MVFKSFRVEALYTLPYRLHRCWARASWGFQLWIDDKGDCLKIFEQTPLPTSECGPWTRAWRPMCNGFDCFCALQGCNCLTFRWTNQSRHFHRNVCDFGGNTGRRCCGSTFVEEALHSSILQAQSCNNSAHQIERLFCAIAFLNGSGWTMILALSVTNLPWQPICFQNREINSISASQPVAAHLWAMSEWPESETQLS